MATHVHLHFRDKEFEEQSHPRGKAGKFVAKGTGVAKKGVQAVKKVAGKAAVETKRRLANLTQEDYEVLEKNLHHPKSTPRKKTAAVVLGFAKSVPQLVRNHLKEEKHKAIFAAKALKSMSTGKRPTPEELKGLRQFGVTVLLSAGSMAAHGDATGTVAHIISAFAQELAHHSVIEHSAKLGLGATRFARMKTRLRRQQKSGTGDAAALTDEDYGLLGDYLKTLASVVENKRISDDRSAELLDKRRATTR